MRIGKDRVLGVARDRRHYDLPLHRAAGTGWMLLLVASMTFLAALGLTLFFAMSAMTARWSSGLEHTWTIEIPPQAVDGTVIPPAELRAAALSLVPVLRENPLVAHLRVLSDQDVQALLAPWFGESVDFVEWPLPVLISVTLDPQGRKQDPHGLTALEEEIRERIPHATLDTHEAWLSDLLRLAKTLQFGTVCLSLMMGAITALAVAGAVQNRLAVHREEVSLLYLMGARDSYITRQFQRHAMILGFQGGVAGVAVAGFCIAAIGLFAGEAGSALLPDFHLSALHMVALAALPCLGAALAGVSARVSVLRTLARMP